MKKIIVPVRALTLSVVLLLSVSAVSFGQEPGPALNLEGKSFKIDLVDAQNNTTHDVLNFNKTSFTCNAIQNTSYDATRYQVTEQPDGRLFLYAIAISQTDGNITWKGHIDGDDIEGGMLINKPGQPTEKHLFKGTSSLNTKSDK